MKKTFLIFLLSLTVLTACSSSFPGSEISSTPEVVVNDSENQNSQPQPSDQFAQPEQAFTLAIGDSIIFQPAGLTIEFVEVKSDSRCPADVVCVWAGEATVHIKSTTQGPPVEADLTIPNTEKNSILLKGDVGSSYNLQFLDLKPYPNSKNPSKDEYKATFVFEAAK
jgi:hypothetical protein